MTGMEIIDCPPVWDRKKWSRTSKNFRNFSEGQAEVMEITHCLFVEDRRK